MSSQEFILKLCLKLDELFVSENMHGILQKVSGGQMPFKFFGRPSAATWRASLVLTLGKAASA